MNPDKFFSDLDTEIAKVLKQQELLRKKKSKSRVAHNTRAPSRLRDAAKADLAEINKQLNFLIWTPLATVAFFAEQHCKSCQSSHHIFLQYMQKETTGKKAPTTRWLRVHRPDLTLPRETMIQRTSTTICSNCADLAGFDLHSAEIKHMQHTDPFTPSPEIEETPCQDKRT